MHALLCGSIELSCHSEKKPPQFCPSLPCCSHLCQDSNTPIYMSCLSAQDGRGKHNLSYDLIKNLHILTQAIHHSAELVAMDIFRILPFHNFLPLKEKEMWFLNCMTLRIVKLLKLNKKSCITEKADLLMSCFLARKIHSLRHVIKTSRKEWIMTSFVVFLYFERESYPHLYITDAFRFGRGWGMRGDERRNKPVLAVNIYEVNP